MASRLKTFFFWLESLINGFNLAFFIISTVLWAALTVVNLSGHPFTFDLLWSASNTLFGEISFQISCLLLIVLNGIRVIKDLADEYFDLKEKLQHTTNLKRMISHKNPHKGL